MVSHDRALRQWFSECAERSREDQSRQDPSRDRPDEGRHPLGLVPPPRGTWLRYTMDGGILEPAPASA